MHLNKLKQKKEIVLKVAHIFKPCQLVGTPCSSGLIHSGYIIKGTWPMRTELGNRLVGAGTNALASSIVLVCRPGQQMPH